MPLRSHTSERRKSEPQSIDTHDRHTGRTETELTRDRLTLRYTRNKSLTCGGLPDLEWLGWVGGRVGSRDPGSRDPRC